MKSQIELWRRGILLMGVILAIWLHFFFPLTSFVTVKTIDFADEQKNESRLIETGQYLAQLPLNEYVAEKIKDRVISVSGAEWNSFFASALKTSCGESLSADWARRVSQDEKDRTAYYRLIFFRTDEPPLAALAQRFSKEGESYVLVLQPQDAVSAGDASASAFSPSPRHLMVEIHVMTHDDFHFGSGYSHAPRLPSWLAHPWRKYALPILLIAFALYLILPDRKRPSRAIYYPAWRARLGDLASLILFVPFFTIPILVAGGSVQAITVGWILALVCWPLALAAVWLLRFMAWYASYQIVVEREGLHLSTMKDDAVYRFSDMTSFQPVELKPPRWLVVASAISALLGRGAARFGGAGRSLLLSSAAERGFGVKLKDGSSVFVWVASSMSGQTMKNADKLGEALKGAGVPWDGKVKSIASISMPEGETAAGKLKTPGLRVLTIIFLFPLAAILIFTALASSGAFSGRTKSFAAAEPAKAITAHDLEEAARTQPLDASIEWETTLKINSAEDQPAYGQKIAGTGDGGYVAAGYVPVDDINFDAFLTKVDGRGRQAWTVTMGGDVQDYISAVLVEDQGGYFLAGESRPYNSLLGKSDIFLARVDSSGAKLWEKNIGREDADESALAVQPVGADAYIVWGVSGSDLLRLRIDGTGRTLNEEGTSLAGKLPEGSAFIGTAFTRDGGLILTGEALNSGVGFKELLLAKYDARGALAWWKMFGGKKKESGSFVKPTLDRGYIAVGVSESAGAGEDLYMIRTDERGTALWEKAVGGPGDQYGIHAAELDDGGFSILGISKAAEGSPEKIYLVDLDAGGALVREKTLGREGAIYSPKHAISAAGGETVILADRDTTSGYESRVVLIKLKRS